MPAHPSPLARQLCARHALSSDDLMALARLESQVDPVPKGADIIVEGQHASRIHVVVDGWAARYRVLPDGRRQILNFAVPGDLLGVQLALLSSADHSICAISDVELATFPASQLDAIARDHPALAKAIHWAAMREWSMMCERLVSVGRRCATDRIAHLLLELRARLRFVGRADGASFDIPVTQELIADCLGLTHVHVSRSMRKLRERGLVRYERHRVVIVDVDRLAAETDFSEDYLDHGPERLN